ncbi:glutathione peroxidase [Paenibacillus alginolyticus]|uniref:Glutathione peroxidase n=1 Tax=Paenibacillus alginolyticus TaxID=59839 RepID=A0ABT4GL77_9BACL|nr:MULTISPECIES: glutathione peroxidase [Paenibacillus]MCY9665398.1 glutathione peroxidase [Paenibacillus alginolyticus]MCY9696965.1 glutathione peroxidase [Paenibacillus alginolyticus]MEC0147351.1 glutathione peroxidase [Paenibacillus alginolyticus]NRF94872.1 glutathione peroxidase [Paenibacillus frigoriresistens]
MSIYNIDVQTISGETKSLSEYKGKVLLIVNTASACGLTPHYKGLQSLYEQYQDQGLVVLGFPCNQFGGQEPGTNEEIQSFCEINYKVTFPLFDKIDVKGEHAHPLYTYLLNHTPEPYRTGEIEWNFVKFLVDASGIVVKQYSASTDPETIAPDIEAILA